MYYNTHNTIYIILEAPFHGAAALTSPVEIRYRPSSQPNFENRLTAIMFFNRAIRVSRYRSALTPITAHH